MSKLTIVDAVKVIPVSESTLRRDLRTGKVSFTTAKNGNQKVIDAAELERVYGQLNGIDSQINGNGGVDDAQIRALLENQIADLRSQLEIATTEKTKLLDLLFAEKEEKRALMPPVDEKNDRKISQLAAPSRWCAVRLCQNRTVVIKSYQTVFL